MELSNRSLHSRPGLGGTADVVVSLDRSILERVAANDVDVRAAVSAGEVVVIGDAQALYDIVDNLDTFRSGFPIVEP